MKGQEQNDDFSHLYVALIVGRAQGSIPLGAVAGALPRCYVASIGVDVTSGLPWARIA